MKEGIHPTFYPDALVVCACGNTWHTGSTKKEIHTDVCSNCHPFYTGEQRIVDTAGQVERFMKRVSAKEQLATPEVQAKPTKKERRARTRQIRSGIYPGEEPAAEEVAGAPVQVTPVQTPQAETNVAPETATPEGAAAEAGQLKEQGREQRRRSRPPRGEGQGEQRPRAPRKPRGERPAQPAAEQASAQVPESIGPSAEVTSTPEAKSAEPRAEELNTPQAAEPGAAVAEERSTPEAAESNAPQAEQPKSETASDNAAPVEGSGGE